MSCLLMDYGDGADVDLILPRLALFETQIRCSGEFEAAQEILQLDLTGYGNKFLAPSGMIPIRKREAQRH